MKLSIVLILLFQFLNCSYVYVNHDYNSPSTTKKNLLIYPVPISNIIIEDSTLLKLISSDFKVPREDAIIVVDSLLNHSIANAFERYSNCNRIIITSCNQSTDSSCTRHISPRGLLCDSVVKRLTGECIPSAAFFDQQHCEVDYILFISGIELDISHDLDIDGGFNSPMIEVSLAKRYVFDADDVTYKIWDYARNRFICNGTLQIDTVVLRCDQPFVEVPQNGNCDNRSHYWPAVFAPIGAAIVNATPFKINKDVYWGE